MTSRKAGWSLGITLLVILLLVAAEVATLLWVAGEIGWWTLALLMGTTLLGLYLMQREWRKTWGELSAAIRVGQLPTGRVADTSLILVGGILLVLPGLLSDVAGLLLLLPFTRPFVRSALSWWLARTVRPESGFVGPTIIKGEATQESDETLIPRIEPTNDEAADGQVIRGDLDDS